MCTFKGLYLENARPLLLIEDGHVIINSCTCLNPDSSAEIYEWSFFFGGEKKVVSSTPTILWLLNLACFQTDPHFRCRCKATRLGSRSTGLFLLVGCDILILYVRKILLVFSWIFLKYYRVYGVLFSSMTYENTLPPPQPPEHLCFLWTFPVIIFFFNLDALGDMCITTSLSIIVIWVKLYKILCTFSHVLETLGGIIHGKYFWYKTGGLSTMTSWPYFQIFFF